MSSTDTKDLYTCEAQMLIHVALQLLAFAI